MGEEKIDLKKHKEIFKILPDDEYKSLEQAIERGLYVTPFKIGGEGKEFLKIDENVIKALPSSYNNFRKIETLKEKQENIKISNKSIKEWLRVDGDQRIGIALLEGLETTFAFFGGIIMVSTNPAVGIPLLIYSSSTFICGAKEFCKNNDKDPYYSPNSLLIASVYKGLLTAKNGIRKKRKNILSRKTAKQKGNMIENILKIKQGTIEPEEFNYIKNIDTIKNDDKLIEMFEKRGKGLKELLNIVLNKDIEEYREKIDLLKRVALEEASKIELEPKTLKPFSDYCRMLGLDMKAIRKEIGKRGNEIFQAVHCPLVTPKAKQATQKPALDKELSEWVERNGLASLDMFFEQPECIDDTLLQRKVMDITDSIIKFPEKDGVNKEDVNLLKEYYKTAKKAVDKVGKGLGCGDLLDDYDGLLLNSIMCGVEELYKGKKLKLPTPPRHVPEVKIEQKQAEEAETKSKSQDIELIEGKKKKEEKKRVLIKE